VHAPTRLHLTVACRFVSCRLYSRSGYQVALWLGQEFVAGLLAGAFVDGCLYPLDTLRARMQVGVLPTGMVRELVQLVRAEGIPALYKGLPLQMIASGPGCGIFYAVYEHSKLQLKPHLPNGPVRSSVAASLACAASLVVFTPVEVIKQRAMVKRGVGSMSILHSVLRDHGPLGLFAGGRGLSGLLCSVPYSAVYFLIYESLLSRRGALNEPPTLSQATGYGLISGIVAASLTNPCDVVRTRIQVGGSGLQPGGWIAMASHIVKSEGARGFSRGLLPRVLLLAPASALTVATFGWWMQAISCTTEPL